MMPTPSLSFRRARLGLLAVAWLGWAGLSAARLAAQEFNVLDLVREAGGAVRVTHPSAPEFYHLLQRGERVESLTTVVAGALGASGTGTLRDTNAPAGTGFYRVQRIPINQPLDSDGDGIDDIYELRNAPALSLLDGSDARKPASSGLTWREQFQRDKGQPVVVTETSPAHLESGVAVTRETVLRFSRPLAADALLNTERLYATFGGRKLLSRAELSSDRRKATLFYLEDLPASARVRVTLDPSGIRDESGRELDGDGDGEPGGAAIVDFDTLSITPVGETGVVGRIFASDPMADGKGGFTNRPLAGVTITVDGAEQTLRTTTDATGFFQLQPVPAGRFFVHVDGRTAVGSQWPGGAYYPFVGKAWEAVAGVKTNLAAGTGEIFLPLVPAGALQAVSATQTTMVTFTAETLAANPLLAGAEVRVPPTRSSTTTACAAARSASRRCRWTACRSRCRRG